MGIMSSSMTAPKTPTSTQPQPAVARASHRGAPARSRVDVGAPRNAPTAQAVRFTSAGDGFVQLFARALPSFSSFLKRPSRSAMTVGFLFASMGARPAAGAVCAAGGGSNTPRIAMPADPLARRRFLAASLVSVAGVQRAVAAEDVEEGEVEAGGPEGRTLLGLDVSCLKVGLRVGRHSRELSRILQVAQ